MWTHFWDMHSGGGTKEEPYNHIYIEAEEDEAKKIFYNRFGHNPERVSCTCCGEDYSISEYETLEEATDFQRRYGLRRDTPCSFDDFCKADDVLLIRAEDIQPEDREGEVPSQGYVWID